MVEAAGTYHLTLGDAVFDLPVVPLTDDLAVALLITVDHGVARIDESAIALAGLLAPFGPEVVATPATLGIPVGIGVSRALGLDDYLVLHKTPKFHLRDALTEPVTSITTGPQQLLRLDDERRHCVEGRRVAFVDDVISTGSSAAAAVALLRRAGAHVVAIGALATETEAWRRALGPDAPLMRALASMPVFRRGPGGALVEDWDG